MITCALWDIESRELTRRPREPKGPSGLLSIPHSAHCLSILKHGHIIEPVFLCSIFHLLF